MRKFIFKTLIFMLPICLIALTMEILLRLIPNDYYFKKKFLDAHSNDIETLILGNSHSYYGINPIYFSNNSFNASYISQSLNYDLKILKKYEHNWSKLKIIVLPISYFSLLVKLDAASDSWRVKNYIIYYGINISNGMAYHTEMLSNKLSVNVKRIISFYLKRNTAITCSSLGWGVSYNSKNARDLVETGKDSAKRQTILDFKYFNDIVSTLKSIIEFGRMYNIKIVLFTPPAYETYFENLNKEQLKKTIQTAEDISNQFENCMYFNFLENKSFTKLDFFDADHLNENGAEKLTLLINNKIKDIK
jgi:hypothetical protein